MYVVKKACHFDRDYLIGEHVTDDVLDRNNIRRLKDMGVLEEVKSLDKKTSKKQGKAKKPLEEMTRAEMIAYAEEKGIAVDKKQKKNDILSVITNGNIQL